MGLANVTLAFGGTKISHKPLYSRIDSSGLEWACILISLIEKLCPFLIFHSKQLGSSSPCTMTLAPSSVGYPETTISVDASTLPTTPEDSLNGTDKLDDESNGSRTTVTDESDPESTTTIPQVRSICCVGAGYVGTSKSITDDTPQRSTK